MWRGGLNGESGRGAAAVRLAVILQEPGAATGDGAKVRWG